MNGRGRPVLAIPPSGTNSLLRLPTYVEHGGEIACRHPADAINSRMYGFAVKADRDRLDDYCERVYNRPTGGEQQWEALCDEVLLNFVNIGAMGSTDPLDQQLGVCQESEAAIWLPMVERTRSVFAWGIPYMFVDQALALVGGREVYGFPKQLGTLKVPRDNTAPSELTVNSVTVDRYLPSSVARDYRVLTVKRAGRRAQLDSPWTQLSEAFADMVDAVRRMLSSDQDGATAAGWLERKLADAIRLVEDVPADLLFFKHLVEQNAPMLLLKQFRDAHEPGAACYQALVLVNMAVQTFRAGGLLPDDYHVTIELLDGEPISRELGIDSSCDPRLAFWLDFDFQVDLGEILWEAPNT